MTTRTTIPRPRRAAREAGLTLIELMISVLLATMLTGGLFYMMQGQQRTYASQLSNLSAQENLWGAMEYLQAQIRKAGYGFGGCPNGVIQKWDGGNGASNSFMAINIQNSLNLYTGAADTSDSFSVTYATGDSSGGILSVKLYNVIPGASAEVIVNQSGGIKNNDLLVAWDPGSTQPCVIVKATQDAQNTGAGWKVQTAPDGTYNAPGGLNQWRSGVWKAGALLIRIGNNTAPRNFAIDKSRNPPLLVSWTASNKSDLEIIAEGIEDMQIAWACDVNQNGVYEESTTSPTTDEWAYASPSDSASTVPACGTMPIGAVRITLIARTAAPIVGDRGGQLPAAEDRAAGSTDQALGVLGSYGRAVLTSVIKPRNIRNPLNI
jgi:type IV pilus assembly protein PilW